METLSFPQLKTERLQLRQLNESDADVIFFLRSDAAVNFFIKRDPAQDKVEALAFIEKVNQGFFEERNFYWGITWGKRLVGTICLWNFSEDRKTAEVGYELLPEFQRKGIMDEALKSVLDFGFLHLNLFKIEAFTDKNNENSKNLLVKNGFELCPERKDEGNSENLIYEKSMKFTP